MTHHHDVVHPIKNIRNICLISQISGVVLQILASEYGHAIRHQARAPLSAGRLDSSRYLYVSDHLDRGGGGINLHVS